MPNTRDLKALIELRGREPVERLLGVHRTTVTRWLDGSVRMPEHAQLMVSMLLGNMPGTDGQWEGFRFWKGKLYCREWREGFTAGEVVGIPHLHQRIALLERLLDQKDEVIASLVKERAVREVAANDAAEVRPAYRPRGTR